MRFQYASLRSKPPILQPLNPCPVCGAETTLAEIEPTLCTLILKFTAISVTDVDRSNPWLCFAGHRFNRCCSPMRNAVDPRRGYLSAVDRVLFALVFACILFAGAYYVR